MGTTLKHILCPVDGSDTALRAVQFAAGIAKDAGAALEIVAVLDLGQLEFMDTVHLNDEQLDEWQEDLKEKILADAVAAITDSGISSTTTLLQRTGREDAGEARGAGPHHDDGHRKVRPLGARSLHSGERELGVREAQHEAGRRSSVGTTTPARRIGVRKPPTTLTARSVPCASRQSPTDESACASRRPH